MVGHGLQRLLLSGDGRININVGWSLGRGRNGKNSMEGDIGHILSLLVFPMVSLIGTFYHDVLVTEGDVNGIS
jgi:hypothetical protein